MTRIGLDIALIVLAVLACWQLRQFSAVGASGAGGIDPVLALAPALALAAGSVVVLRLLPLAAVVADWLAARGRGLLAALASWQFSRMPVRQGSAALLLVMAVAAGTLALAQHQSWTRSASDQANFAAGADVQVDLPAPLSPGGTGAMADARGVTRSMAVAVDGTGTPGELVAIDSAQAAGVVRLRGDETLLRLPACSGITPSAADQPGAALPAQPGAGAGNPAHRDPRPGRRHGSGGEDNGGGRETASAGRRRRSRRARAGRHDADHPRPDGSRLPGRRRGAGRGWTPARDRGAARRRRGALPAAGGLDLGHVRNAAQQRPDPRPDPAGPVVGRLDAAGNHADPINFAPGQGAEPSDGKRITADAATFTFGAGDAPDFSVGAGGPGSDQLLAAQLLLLPHEPRCRPSRPSPPEPL